MYVEDAIYNLDWARLAWQEQLLKEVIIVPSDPIAEIRSTNVYLVLMRHKSASRQFILEKQKGGLRIFSTIDAAVAAVKTIGPADVSVKFKSPYKD